jgi:hypothetical protein
MQNHSIYLVRLILPEHLCDSLVPLLSFGYLLVTISLESHQPGEHQNLVQDLAADTSTA